MQKSSLQDKQILIKVMNQIKVSIQFKFIELKFGIHIKLNNDRATILTSIGIKNLAGTL